MTNTHTNTPTLPDDAAQPAKARSAEYESLAALVGGPMIAAEAPALPGEPHEHSGMLERVLTLLAVLLPPAALIAAIILLWGPGFGWTSFGLLLGGYMLTGMGITVGYHRYFTHKSFETNVVVKAALGILGSMSVQGSLLRWAATHRSHHQHSDRHDDPHSPHTHGDGFWGRIKGAWHAHMGWFIKPNRDTLMRYVPDLQQDKLTLWISRLFPLWVLLGLLIPAGIALAITGTWTGALLGFLWGGLVRIMMVHHITWSVNSVCHLWGNRPYKSHDHSRNNAIFGVLAFGEGWHNNHHAFPTSARHGLRWWQFDMSYMVIRAMGWVGLAKEIRVPSHARRHAKMTG